MSEETTVMANGTVLEHHAKEHCKPPCALHQKIPGPWESWPLGYQEAPFGADVMIMVRFCEHGIPHPCVEQFAHWAEQNNDRYAYHHCCGCPCVPSGVLSGQLRVPMTPEAIAFVAHIPRVQEPEPEVRPRIEILFDELEPAGEDEEKLDEPVPEDPRINIPDLKIPGLSSFRGRIVVRRSILLDYAKKSWHAASGEIAQKILGAYDAQVALVGALLPAPMPVPTPMSASANPNVVADEYLKAIRPHIDDRLHQALTLLFNVHVIHAVDVRVKVGHGESTHYVDSCGMDCNDYFKAGEIATDDDACVTLKLAILGGYVPEKWSDDD